MTLEVEKVTATDEARRWLKILKEKHGDLLMHQYGGCCDGSAPMCYPANEFKVGGQDVFLGEIDSVKVYIGKICTI